MRRCPVGHALSGVNGVGQQGSVRASTVGRRARRGDTTLRRRRRCAEVAGAVRRQRRSAASWRARSRRGVPCVRARAGTGAAGGRLGGRGAATRCRWRCASSTTAGCARDRTSAARASAARRPWRARACGCARATSRAAERRWGLLCSARAAAWLGHVEVDGARAGSEGVQAWPSWAIGVARPYARGQPQRGARLRARACARMGKQARRGGEQGVGPSGVRAGRAGRERARPGEQGSGPGGSARAGRRKGWGRPAFVTGEERGKGVPSVRGRREERVERKRKEKKEEMGKRKESGKKKKEGRGKWRERKGGIRADAMRSRPATRDGRVQRRMVGHARVARRGGWDNGCSGQRNGLGIWGLGF